MAHGIVSTVGKGARQGDYEFEASLGYITSTCQGVRMEGGGRGAGVEGEGNRKKKKTGRRQSCDSYQCKQETEIETMGDGCSKMVCQNKCLLYF